MCKIRYFSFATPLQFLAFACLVAVLTVPLSKELFAQDEEDEEKITYRVTGDVYHGDKYRFSAPCVLEREKIFAKIPAFQTIKREGLDKSNARYYILIEQANRVFRAKLTEVSRKLKYDLVVEKGGVRASVKGVHIPDITRKVIKAITEKDRTSE